MDPQVWNKVVNLYHRAQRRSVAGEDWEELLARESDAEVAARVRAMLAQDDPATGFLSPPGEAIERLPECVGDWVRIAPLGSGGRGTVWASANRKDGRRGALKVLRLAARMSELQRERFRREGEAVAKLTHPGIVRVLEVGEDRGLPFLVMEHVAGRNLAAELSASKAGQKTALPATPGAQRAAVTAWVRAVAEAVHYAHERGVVHRDIKPANVILRADATPCLVDFGLARDAGNETVTGTGDLEGTPVYMSPEQVRGERARVDARTDVYALGVMLYELLSGQRPFEGETPRETLRRVEQADPTPLRRLAPGVPAPLARICHMAMEERPEDRYPTAMAMAEDLGRFLDDRPVRARAPALWRRLMRQTRRHPRVSVGTAVVASLFAGAFLVPGERPPAVTVELRVEAESPGPYRVFAQPLDDVGSCGPPEEVARGRTPGEAAHEFDLVPRGWRITVARDERIFAELDRWLDAGAPELQTVAYLRDIGPGALAATRFEGGTWRSELSFTDPTTGAPARRSVEAELPPFDLGVRLLTCRQYRDFQVRTGRPAPLRWPSPPDQEWLDLALFLVRFEDAQSLAEFHGFRLPSLAEWEWAVRGPDGWKFPWGDVADERLDSVPLGVTPFHSQPDYADDTATGHHRWARDFYAGATGVSGRGGLQDLLAGMREWTTTPAPGWLGSQPQARLRAGLSLENTREYAARNGLSQPIGADPNAALHETSFRPARSGRPLGRFFEDHFQSASDR